MSKKRCWQTRCSEEGKPNFKAKYGYDSFTYEYYSCIKHKASLRKILKMDSTCGFIEIDSTKRNGVCCSLILCKDCMSNVREVISY